MEAVATNGPPLCMWSVNRSNESMYAMKRAKNSGGSKMWKENIQ